jgi:DegV family protein with EDD domain
MNAGGFVMNSMKIILDSTGDIPFEWFKEKDVENIPLHVLWENPNETEDDIRVSEEIERYWGKIQSRPNTPKTSQPTPAEFSALFSKAFQEGYTEVLALCLSSKMSGTYNSAEIAARDFPGKVEVVDTKLASAANALIARRARELADQKIAVRRIKEILDREISEKRFGAYFYVSDFEFLKKGGRISKFASFLGNMLKLRVSLFISDDGNLMPFAKNKGTEKTHDALLKAVLNVYPEKSRINLVMVYTINTEEAKILYNRLSEIYTVADVNYSPMGKVISSHVGPYATGFGIERIS